MKNKMLILLAAAGLFAASCNKTYECKDQTGNISGEVKARSQSKATSLCNQGRQNPETAEKK